VFGLHAMTTVSGDPQGVSSVEAVCLSAVFRFELLEI